MPREDADLGFTFDTTAFKKGFAALEKGMSGLSNNAKAMAKGISQGLTNVLAKIGLVAGAFRLIKGAIDNMPEIGKAFGIAKDTILKNLLFPLRQEIIPLLQQMLDWVRDNRATFVKWGQVLAGVFRTVVNGLKMAVDFAKKATDGILEFANRIFGTTIGGIDEAFNLVAFKIATVIEFIKALIQPLKRIIQPIIDLIADNLTVVIEGIGQAISGILPWIDDIATGVGGLIENILSFVRNVADIVVQSGSLRRVFDGIGRVVTRIVDLFREITGQMGPLENFLGTALSGLLNSLAFILNGVADALEKVIEFFSGDAFKRGLESIGSFFKGIGDKAADIFFPNRPGGPGNNPPPDGGGPGNNPPPPTIHGDANTYDNRNIEVGGININLQNGSPEEARQAGEEFIEGMRNQWDKDFRSRGY